MNVDSRVIYYQIEESEEKEEKETVHDILMRELKRLNKESEELFQRTLELKEKRLNGHA